MGARKAQCAGSGGVCHSLEIREDLGRASPSSDPERRQEPSQPEVRSSCFRSEEKLLRLKVSVSISIYWSNKKLPLY